MSPNRAAKAKQEVRNLLTLGLVQPSYSHWASGFVMVKKKSGELRFCCDFRPLNDMTVKDPFLLPRIDESLSRIGNAKIFTSIDLAWAFWQVPLTKCDRGKTAFAWLIRMAAHAPLGYATHQPHSSDPLQEPCKTFNKDMGVSSWPISTTL